MDVRMINMEVYYLIEKISAFTSIIAFCLCFIVVVTAGNCSDSRNFEIKFFNHKLLSIDLMYAGVITLFVCIVSIQMTTALYNKKPEWGIQHGIVVSQHFEKEGCDSQLEKVIEPSNSYLSWKYSYCHEDRYLITFMDDNNFTNYFYINSNEIDNFKIGQKVQKQP